MRSSILLGWLARWWLAALFAVSLVLSPVRAFADSSGPNNPGTLTQVGSVWPWGTEANAATSNNSYAYVAVPLGEFSNNLQATNFGFSIPSGATITGVVAEIEAHNDNNVANDTTIKLIKGGSLTGNNKATATSVGTSDAYRTYGGSSDLWGTTLTPSDVNAADFGFAAVYDPPTKDNVYVDHMRVTVYYTSAGGSSSSAGGVPFFPWWSLPLLLAACAYAVHRQGLLTAVSVHRE